MSDDSLKARNAQLSRLLAKAGLAAEQRDIADQVQRLLTDELHHRSKNMLAMVTAIVRQSMRGAVSLEEAEAAIVRRLVAMGRAQDLLRKADWQAADLGDVIRNAIDQHNADTRRIRLDGPQIEAGSAAILPLTLIINELCTNATKYGALSRDEGLVSLAWAKDEIAGTFAFHWRESGGPPVSSPRARGFGSSLIEHALPRQLGGSGKLDFAPAGIHFELRFPLEKLGAPA